MDELNQLPQDPNSLEAFLARTGVGGESVPPDPSQAIPSPPPAPSPQAPPTSSFDSDAAAYEQAVRAQIMSTPEERARQKMLEYYGMTQGQSRPPTKKLLTNMFSEFSKSMREGKDYVGPNERAKADALAEYKAVAPIMARETAVASAERRASEANASKEKIAKMLDETKKFQIQVQKARNEALDAYQQKKLGIDRELATGKIGYLDAQTQKMETENNFLNLYHGLEKDQRLTAIIAEGGPQAQATLNAIFSKKAMESLGKSFGGDGGGAGTTSHTSSLPSTTEVVDPVRGITKTTPGETTRFTTKGGGMSPLQALAGRNAILGMQMGVPQQPQGEASPLSQFFTSSKGGANSPSPIAAAPQASISPQTSAPVRPGNLPSRLNGPKPGAESKGVEEYKDQERQMEMVATGVADMYADKSLDKILGYGQNMVPNLAEKVRGKWNMAATQEQQFDMLTKPAEIEKLKAAFTARMSDKERQFLQPNFPSKEDGVDTATQKSLLMHLFFQLDKYRRERGMQSIMQLDPSVVKNMRMRVDGIMNDLKQGRKTNTPYHVTQQDFDIPSLFIRAGAPPSKARPKVGDMVPFGGEDYKVIDSRP